VGLYRTTPQGEILDANRALVNLLGFTDREALLTVPITDLFVDQSEREQELAILNEKGILRDYEIRLRRWDGGIIWAQDTCRTVRDSEGQLLYFEGGLEEITKRKRTEEALRESEERFRNIFENAPIGIYRSTPAGQIMMANPTLVDMLGYDSFTELSQRDLENEGFLSDSPRSVFKRRIAETESIIGLEAAWRRKDGSALFVRENARVVRDQDGTVLYYEGTVEDITERKEMEERLRRQERLAAIGQMAGGIAHDFRNFLTSIILYAQLPLRRSDVSPDVETSLDTIVSEAQQAANLVQQILDFSRRSTMKTELIDLYQFTKEVTHVLQETIPETIDIRLQGTTDCCPVKADPTRIQQVLMNLTLNARDAMPEGGNLLIRLHRVQVEANEEPLPEIEPGQWICLTVSDTGTGLSEEAQEHLFEPFFTTKEPGKGTGLGLAQVYGIVRQHEGYIDVQTAAGEGTTFRIYLPLHQDEERPPREKPPELVPGHGELILLVEDEREVREAARQVLESLGYRVLTAANGRETEALARERDLDLLITDLVMPDMDGWALIKSLKKRHPDLKTIAMTGYALEDELQDMAVEIIQKPLDSETLSQAIRRALDGD
jgi:PAS domain S-box-containing protein